MSRYQRAIEDTVVERGVCGACHGCGTFTSMTIRHELVQTECEACGGTGVTDPALQRSVLREQGMRCKVQPGYDQPTE